jgi:hypothetical protein
MAEINQTSQTSDLSGSQQNRGFESATALATLETMVTAHNNDPKRHSWFDTTAAKVTGVAFALGATYITARDAISRGFFKTVNKGEQGAFMDIQKTRDDAIAEATNAAKGSGGKTHGVAVADAKTKIREAVKAYDKELAVRRKLLGFNNVFDEMTALKKHQWLEVAFATGAVASVAVGAIMAIASSRSKVKKLEEQVEKSEAPQR